MLGLILTNEVLYASARARVHICLLLRTRMCFRSRILLATHVGSLVWHADGWATTRCLRLQEAYEQIKRQMIEALAPDRRGQMEAAFEKLMVGVLRNLESRNRDKFTQNLTAFRQEVKAFLNA